MSKIPIWKVRWLALIGLAAGMQNVTLAPAAAQGKPDTRDHTARKRFFVRHSRDKRDADADAFCEFLIQQVGVARLVDSEREADFILTSALRYSSSIHRQDHTKEVETSYTENGQKKTKKEDVKTHQDDVLTVGTGFACRIAAISSGGDPVEVAVISKSFTRSSQGKNTPGHGADDRPIHINSFEAPRMEERLGSLADTEAQAALYKEIYDLCGVYGSVTEIDRAANRITVALGSESGIRDKDDPAGVTEMSLYAQTGHTRDYVFQHSVTGKLYVVDGKSADAQPDKPEAWTYVRTDLLRGEPKRSLQGEATIGLLPLGEKVSDWAEAQEVFTDHCVVALKRKGDFGRTTDDTDGLKRLPDPHTTPVLARVRVKKGNLRVK